MRLDQYLVEKGYFPTRTRAQDAIGKGCISVDGKTITKNSYAIEEGKQVTVLQEELVLASRAGFKLYDVVEDFQLCLQDRICIDVGASTGGFSDVCLRQGAKRVYAVDVGHDQLLEHLKNDPRIVNMEGVNCRYLTKDMFSPQPDFACMDVSFISVKLILPALISCMAHKELVILIKPQFEAGNAYVNKHGIVREERVHVQVLKDMLEYVSSLQLYVHHLQASSIFGRGGNKEFVMHIKEEPCRRSFDLVKIVREYHVKR